ncbi:hypothetical protein FRACYDRAFT_240047 [Fragilariopsis cylindrus CCMP1102]|uniref:Uncharacterized protein n=1 Tax=Fragilariopsis cylindrus CCMP1102 TaxID=635003 RepID=A0A1E7FB39_9STRA|nr:hypothetical protein FRACYDRAFT_240047 [Fragilariopsis cylindrus CCMP1102]|eukprot:OEU15361.1 hypothetical protein FRACYDRAFT_240047 [Fragilariopsis cylindrus CCMP1102]
MSAIINDDDTAASENISINTLAAFLTDSSEKSHTITSNDARASTSSLEANRKYELKKEAVINAINQFILQAGNIYRGKKLSTLDASRLRDSATHAGLSMEVVDTLLEQTAGQNAVVDYCMTSNDAFARNIRKDPHLSRMLLEMGEDQKSGDGLNVTNSIWRICMHKIIQQLLKEQNMRLGDIIKKSPLTGRLYEEALRCDPNETKFGLTKNASRLPRDYSEERKHVFITESDAKLARIEAESMTKFKSRTPFNDIVNRNFMYKPPPGESYPESRDDDLSITPCATEREVPPSLSAVLETDENLIDENLTNHDMVNNRNFMYKLPPGKGHPESRDDDLIVTPCAIQRELSPSLRAVLETNDGMTNKNSSVIPCATDRKFVSSPREVPYVPQENINSIKTPSAMEGKVPPWIVPEKTLIIPGKKRTNGQNGKPENEGNSAVKRGLEMLEKRIISQVKSSSPVRVERSGHNAPLSGNLLKARAMFEEKDCLPVPNKRPTSTDIHEIIQNGNVKKVLAAWTQQEPGNLRISPKNKVGVKIVPEDSPREKQKNELDIELSDKVQCCMERTGSIQCDLVLKEDKTTVRNLYGKESFEEKQGSFLRQICPEEISTDQESDDQSERTKRSSDCSVLEEDTTTIRNLYEEKSVEEQQKSFLLQTFSEGTATDQESEYYGQFEINDQSERTEQSSDCSVLEEDTTTVRNFYEEKSVEEQQESFLRQTFSEETATDQESDYYDQSEINDQSERIEQSSDCSVLGEDKTSVRNLCEEESFVEGKQESFLRQTLPEEIATNQENDYYDQFEINDQSESTKQSPDCSEESQTPNDRYDQRNANMESILLTTFPNNENFQEFEGTPFVSEDQIGLSKELHTFNERPVFPPLNLNKEPSGQDIEREFIHNTTNDYNNRKNSKMLSISDHSDSDNVFVDFEDQPDDVTNIFISDLAHSSSRSEDSYCVIPIPPAEKIRGLDFANKEKKWAGFESNNVFCDPAQPATSLKYGLISPDKVEVEVIPINHQNGNSEEGFVVDFQDQTDNMTKEFTSDLAQISSRSEDSCEIPIPPTEKSRGPDSANEGKKWAQPATSLKHDPISPDKNEIEVISMNHRNGNFFDSEDQTNDVTKEFINLAQICSRSDDSDVIPIPPAEKNRRLDSANKEKIWAGFGPDNVFRDPAQPATSFKYDPISLDKVEVEVISINHRNGNSEEEKLATRPKSEEKEEEEEEKETTGPEKYSGEHMHTVMLKPEIELHLYTNHRNGSSEEEKLPTRPKSKEKEENETIDSDKYSKEHMHTGLLEPEIELQQRTSINYVQNPHLSSPQVVTNFMLKTVDQECRYDSSSDEDEGRNEAATLPYPREDCGNTSTPFRSNQDASHSNQREEGNSTLKSDSDNFIPEECNAQSNSDAVPVILNEYPSFRKSASLSSSIVEEEWTEFDGVFDRNVLSEQPVSYQQTIGRNPRSSPSTQSSEANMSVVSKSKNYFANLLRNESSSSDLNEGSFGSSFSSGSASRYSESDLLDDSGHDQSALRQTYPSSCYNQKTTETSWETFDSNFDAHTNNSDTLLVESSESMVFTNIDNSDEAYNKLGSFHFLPCPKEQKFDESCRATDNRILTQLSNSMEGTTKASMQRQNRVEECSPVRRKRTTEDALLYQENENTLERNSWESTNETNRQEYLSFDHHENDERSRSSVESESNGLNPLSRESETAKFPNTNNRIGTLSRKVESSFSPRLEPTYGTNEHEDSSSQHSDNDESSRSSAESEFNALNPLIRESETAMFMNTNNNSVTLNEYNSIREHHRGLREFLEQKGDTLGEDMKQQRLSSGQSPIDKLQRNGDIPEQRDHFEDLNAFLADYKRPRNEETKSYDEDTQVNKSRRNVDITKQDPSEPLDAMFGEYQSSEIITNSSNLSPSILHGQNNSQDVDEVPQNLSSTGLHFQNASFNERYSRNHTEIQSTPSELKHNDFAELDKLASTLSDTLQVETVTSENDDNDNGLRNSYQVNWPNNEAENQGENLEITEENEATTPKAGNIGYHHHHHYPHEFTPDPITNFMDNSLMDSDDDQALDAIEKERQNADVSLHHELDPPPHRTDRISYQSDPKPDPSPKGNRRSIDQSLTPILYNTTEVPEGTSKEELNLLNRFIEVASSNFGGNKLSAESESRVRSAALKVGLTSKFVDQLLNKNKKSTDSDPDLTYDAPHHVHHSGHQPVSHQYENNYQDYHHTYRDDVVPATQNNHEGDNETYYTADFSPNTNQNRRREPTVDACDAWGSIRENLGFLLAKTCGINNTDRDDAGSVVSAVSWEYDNVGSSRVRKHQSRGRLNGYDMTEGVNSGHNEIQQDDRMGLSPTVRNDDQRSPSVCNDDQNFQRKPIRTQLV